MKKFFKIILLLFVGNFVFGQDNAEVKPSKKEFGDKGTMFFFWGWNRAGFTKSNIHFKGDGYDFTLHDVIAHDRPSELSWDYIDPKAWSKPQFVLRLGYFVKENLAVVLATDHMKYVMDQDQIAKITGSISDQVYSSMIQNGEINLSDEKFLTFEHTDGLNYVNVGVEKYKSLSNKENVDILWSYGGGIGMLLPKSNVKLFGFDRSDRFHVAGFGTDLRTNINFIFWKRWMARIEGKAGYINMPDVKTTLHNTPDKASHDFFFGQVNFGIGYVFRLKNI